MSAVDTVWVLIAAFLVFFMQAGFGFLEAGFVRSKNVVNFLTGLIIYPVFGHWVWGGGWLAELGYLDFAGSSVVHLVGAYVGLAGTIMLGKRQDKKFGRTIRGHNIPLAALGAFVLWLGWFGFNPGSQLNAEPGAISLIVVTTDFAATTGAITAMFLSFAHTKKWDVSMAFN